MKTVSKGKKGFTLIELLVVISIIAILMAIMIPALRRARSQAVGLICRTQMKDVGTMINMYMADNDGRMVSNAYSGGTRWFGRLGRYYEHLKDTSIQSDRYRTSIFYCPLEFPKRLRAEENNELDKPNSGIMYDMNGFVMDTGSGTDYRRSRFSDPSTWRNASSMPLLYDTNSECTTEELYAPWQTIYPHRSLLKYGWNQGVDDPRNTKTWFRGPAATHGRGVNYLFGDMHVSNTLWPYEETMSNPESPQYYQRYWHPFRDLSVPYLID